MRDQRSLITGSSEGQIIIWQMDSTDTWQLNPRNMLIGHTAPVRSVVNFVTTVEILEKKSCTGSWVGI
jgi:hypothetical protein